MISVYLLLDFCVYSARYPSRTRSQKWVKCFPISLYVFPKAYEPVPKKQRMLPKKQGLFPKKHWMLTKKTQVWFVLLPYLSLLFCESL